MTSELANKIGYAVMMVDADQPSAEVAIDAELTEVREVLEQAEREWMGPHDYEHEIGVIPKDVECDQCELVKRARALYEKLRTDHK